MYLVYYGDQFVHDVYSNDRRVHDGKLSGDVNDYLTLEFTVPPTNPIAKSIKKRDYTHPVVATFDDQVLFRGYVEDTQEQLNTEVKVSCKGDLAMLADSLVRPYTTRQGDTSGGKVYIGHGFETLFTWFINQHNAHVVYTGADGQQHGVEKRFQIKYPPGSGTSLAQECAILDKRGSSDISSQSNPSTLGEIKDKILKALGAYMQLWYDGDTKCLALYADVPELLKNSQVIQFGRNMTDYLYEDSCLDTYTAIRATGGNDANGNTITLAGIADGVKSTNFYKHGDIVYHMANADKYGYREYAWSNSDITDANTLLARALVQLQTIMVSTQSINVSAMDMVFVNSEYKHLLPGQVVTVQSVVHNLNVNLLVSACDIDFDSPGSTKYTMGSPATRITKTYGSIIEDIKISTDIVQQADQQAKSAERTAAAAQQTAQQATAVSVQNQDITSSSRRRVAVTGDTAHNIITPASGISLMRATAVVSGSVRQLYISFSTPDIVQSGTMIGMIRDVPAAPVALIGLAGYVNDDGAVVVKQDLEPGVVYTISVMFVIGVTSV